MKIDLARFRVKENKPVSLAKCPTKIDRLVAKAEYDQALRDRVDRLHDLQEVFYAANRYALLLVFQGMDASGKDSAIDHVLSGVNPQGITVTSFKHPSPEELSHDFLWRAAQRLPPRGRIGVFNRSHYEEVLIARVHPEILAGEAIPDLPKGDAIWKDRFRSITDFESHLCRNGTRIVKFFLHLSKEEQRERFLARLEEPDKNWKFNAGDLTERKFWKRYQTAYEEMLAATSTKQAPWYVVPADRKSDTRLIIAEVILETMKALKLTYPKVSAKQRKELAVLERRLRRNAD